MATLHGAAVMPAPVSAMRAGVSPHIAVATCVFSRGGRGVHSKRAVPVASASDVASTSSSDGVSSDDNKTRHRSSRRATLGSFLGVLASTTTLATPRRVASAATMPDTEPVGLQNNRLRKCPATFNCVSTSYVLHFPNPSDCFKPLCDYSLCTTYITSRLFGVCSYSYEHYSRVTLFVYNHSSTGGAPEQFATAWTAPTATVADAVNQITQAVFRACPDSKKLESYRTEAGDEYVRFAMNGKLGIDNVEFLIKNNGIGDRGWAGDDDRRNEWLVTYRSLATTVTYVYPFTTPVSDFGEQKKRMERIRNEVEWRRVGCEISEYCGGAFDLG